MFVCVYCKLLLHKADEESSTTEQRSSLSANSTLEAINTLSQTLLSSVPSESTAAVAAAYTASNTAADTAAPLSIKRRSSIGPSDHNHPFDREFFKSGHEWHAKYLSKPTWCSICSKFIVGLSLEQQRAYKCKLCRLVCHSQCAIATDDACVSLRAMFQSRKAALDLNDISKISDLREAYKKSAEKGKVCGEMFLV
jgi:hypothetical protein